MAYTETNTLSMGNAAIKWCVIHELYSAALQVTDPITTLTLVCLSVGLSLYPVALNSVRVVGVGQ